MTMIILIDAGSGDSGNDDIVDQACAPWCLSQDDEDAADDKNIERNEGALESTHPRDGWTAL